jgi:exopolysaccharide biosynthesis polyprenyl glycosylphosphotransferase
MIPGAPKVETLPAQKAHHPLQTTNLPHLQLRLSPLERRLLLIFVDLVLLNSALILSVWLWNEFEPTIPAIAAYSKWFITLSCLWLLFGSALDIFNPIRAASSVNILFSVAVAIILTVVIYVATPWLTPKILARNYVFGFIATASLSLIGWRLFYAKLIAQPTFRRRALLLGAWQYNGDLVLDIQQGASAASANPFRGTGYDLVGYIAEQEPEKNAKPALPWLGQPESLPRIARSLHIDEIIVAKEHKTLLDPDLHDVLLDCRELGFVVSPLSDVYEKLTARYPVSYARLDPAMLLSSQDSPTIRLFHFFKRFFDLGLALLGLLALALIAPITALSNLAYSPGPLFYRQQRIGKGGKPFVMFKFRSMIPNAEQDTGAIWSHKQDQRVTAIGRWLRRARLDELPQVINVLRGEMSIVGPRPERPEFAGELMRQLPIYRARHTVKPGITGWAQVCFRYGNSVEDARIKLEYDLYYIKHRGVFLDLLIVLRTLPAMLIMKGV